MEQAFVDYLTSLNIPVSRKYFRKRLASHPDYPSLLSVSDTFENLGIPHGVARMDRASLENLERNSMWWEMLNGKSDWDSDKCYSNLIKIIIKFR